VGYCSSEDFLSVFFSQNISPYVTDSHLTNFLQAADEYSVIFGFQIAKNTVGAMGLARRRGKMRFFESIFLGNQAFY
jgi:hypothetical protein